MFDRTWTSLFFFLRVPVFFLYYLETLGIKNKATFPDVQPKKDINLGVDYTGMQKGRCAFQVCISGITGVQKCRGKAFVLLQTLVVRGRSCRWYRNLAEGMEWLTITGQGGNERFGIKGALKGFLGGSDDKESACNAEDLGMIPGFNPWIGKFPWRRKWQPTPVVLPEKSHGQRSLVGYNPWDLKELDTTEWLFFFFLAQLTAFKHSNILL